MILKQAIEASRGIQKPLERNRAEEHLHAVCSRLEGFRSARRFCERSLPRYRANRSEKIRIIIMPMSTISIRSSQTCTMRSCSQDIRQALARSPMTHRRTLQRITRRSYAQSSGNITSSDSIKKQRRVVFSGIQPTGVYF